MPMHLTWNTVSQQTAQQRVSVVRNLGLLTAFLITNGV